MKRRNFISKTVITSTGAIIIPTIIPSGVMGKNPPSDKINIGKIGMGRIARSLDTRPFLDRSENAMIIACCDVDSVRLQEGKKLIDKSYADLTGNASYSNTKIFEDYREMLLMPDLDAVVISTPDHWHVQPAIEAALAGKDVFMQKPTSLTIAEGRLLSDVLSKKGTVFQMCTQHRTSQQFRIAAELVRNGRIGKLKTVYIGIGGEKPGPVVSEEPVPKQLNYDMWLGSTPWVFYTEAGVHPKEGYGRPGWLPRQQFGSGPLSLTGQHYIDCAAWGMNIEYTGPVSLEGVGEFPKEGLFDVETSFMTIAEYQNGVRCVMSSFHPAGVRYEGDEGWIYAGPGQMKVTDSDPHAGTSKILDAGDRKILESKIGENEIHLARVESMHGNWLDCIKTREQTIVPVEVAHRSCSLCLLGHIANKTGRRLYWDPAGERFINDDDANAMLSRAQRYPYGTDYIDLSGI